MRAVNVEPEEIRALLERRNALRTPRHWSKVERFIRKFWGIL